MSVAGEAVKWVIISGTIIGGGYLLLRNFDLSKWMESFASGLFGDKGVLPQAFDFVTNGVLPWAGKAAQDAGKWVAGAGKDVSKTVNGALVGVGKDVDKFTKDAGKGINTAVSTIGRDVSNLFKGIKL